MKYAILIIQIFLIFDRMQGQNCNFIDSNYVMKQYVYKEPLIVDTISVDTASLPPYVVPPPGARMIFWVHGNGGDEHAFDKVIDAMDNGEPDFPAREAINRTADYATGYYTMNAYADKLLDEVGTASGLLGQDFNEIQQNMLICHSQGGIVARTLNYNLEDSPSKWLFKGMAFFHTSHGGAQILQSAKDGAGQELIKWACPLLTDPLIKVAIFETGPTLSVISPYIDMTTGSDKIIDIASWDGGSTFLCDEVLKLAEVPLAALTGPATDSYLPGASHLTDLASYELDPGRNFQTYCVNFAGVEPDGGYLFWRTIQYFGIGSPNDDDPFDANDDESYKNIADNLDGFYDIMEDAYILKREGCKLVFPIISVILCQPLNDIVHSFERADEFFEDINQRWKIIIGAEKSSPNKQCRVTSYYEDPWVTHFCQVDEVFPYITTQ